MQPEVSDVPPTSGIPSPLAVNAPNETPREVDNDQPRVQHSTQLPCSRCSDAQSDFQYVAYKNPAFDGVTFVQPATVEAMTVDNSGVPDHLRLSIFAAIILCPCVGVAAVVYSTKANATKHIDPKQARKDALTAKYLDIAALIIFLSGLIISSAIIASMEN